MSKKSVRHWLSENKNALFVGLVGSFAWQMICFSFDLVPSIGENIIETILNLLCSNAATISLERMICLLFSFLMGIILGTCSYKTCDFLVNKIKLIKSKLFVKNKLKKDEEENEKSSFEIETENLKIELNKYKNSLTFISILLVVIFAFNIISFEFKMKFDLDMKAIKPYITTEEFDILVSNWVQMKTEEDYINIYDKIKKVKKENGLSSKK